MDAVAADRPGTPDATLATGPPVGPQIVFAMDARGICTLSTGPGLAAIGFEPGQLVGVDLFELYAHDPVAIDLQRRALAGESFSHEREFGGRILSVFYQPTFDADGNVTGVFGVTTDVTEQRAAEAEARAARLRTALLAELSAELSREVLELEAILQLAVRSATEAIGDAGLIWLLDPATSVMRPRAAWGEPDPMRDWRSVADTDLPVDDYLTDVGVRGEPRLIDLREAGVADGTAGEAAARAVRRHDLHTDLRLPLRSRGVLVGALDVARGGDSPPYTDQDVALALEIAERCALAIDNAILLDAERAAHEDMVKFKALTDASANLIAISSTDGRLVYANPRVQGSGIEFTWDDVWRSVEQAIGRDGRVVIEESIRAAGSWSGDLEVAGPTGQVTLRTEVFELGHPRNGRPLGLGWIAEDVTELREAEAAAKAALTDLKQFKALVEASTDFVAIANLDGTVRYINPPGRRLVGMPADVDVSATTISDYLTPAALGSSAEVEQPAVVAHGHWEGESTLRHWAGGAPIPVAIASFLVHDPETGEPFAQATVQRDLSDRIAAERALRDLADQREALLKRLVEAQDAERARIAADVHDDPVQALAAVELRLGLLRRRVRDRAPELIETLDPLQESVSGATDRLRALLFDLEPPDLADGLGAALRRAAEEMFEGAPLRWQVRAEAEPPVSDSVRAVAYRIVREALMNVLKHASAREVAVGLSERDGGLLVTVADDGVGVDVVQQSSPGHRGIDSMLDRAAAAGGRCTVAPGERGGTLVTLWLPGR